MQFKASFSSGDRPLVPWYVRLIVRTLAVFFTAYLVPGVEVDGFTTAIWVAVVLGVLNATVKPLLILLTLPLTLFTMGIFLLVINGIVVVLADRWIDGFALRDFTAAVVMSVVVSALSAVMERLQRPKPPVSLRP
jgi:putative membrane protein